MNKKKILPPKEYYAQLVEGGSCHHDRCSEVPILNIYNRKSSYLI